MENRIAFKITDAQKKEVMDAIKVVVDKLQPLLIALDNKEKQSLAKISDKSIPFVDKVMQYMTSNAEFVPSYINVQEAKDDYAAFTVLREFLRPIEQISDNLDDTAVLAGSEAWQAALAYYNSVKAAEKVGVPNAKAIYDDLRVRFEHSGRRRFRARGTKNCPNLIPFQPTPILFASASVLFIPKSVVFISNAMLFTSPPVKKVSRSVLF